MVPRHPRRSWRRLLATAFAALGGVGVAAGGVAATSASAGTFPVIESFQHATAPGWTLGGTATLTAPTDGDGNGWLRLTPAQQNRAGYAFYDQAFPSTDGIVLDFDYAAYGGTGADGTTFFLYDGTTTAQQFQIGAFGGQLGYTSCGSTPGLRNAYVGIGLDEYGNFTNLANLCSGLDGTAFRPNTIAVRGSQASKLPPPRERCRHQGHPGQPRRGPARDPLAHARGPPLDHDPIPRRHAPAGDQRSAAARATGDAQARLRRLHRRQHEHPRDPHQRGAEADRLADDPHRWCRRRAPRGGADVDGHDHEPRPEPDRGRADHGDDRQRCAHRRHLDLHRHRWCRLRRGCRHGTARGDGRRDARRRRAHLRHHRHARTRRGPRPAHGLRPADRRQRRPRPLRQRRHRHHRPYAGVRRRAGDHPRTDGHRLDEPGDGAGRGHHQHRAVAAGAMRPAARASRSRGRPRSATPSRRGTEGTSCACVRSRRTPPARPPSTPRRSAASR